MLPPCRGAQQDIRVGLVQRLFHFLGVISLEAFGILVLDLDLTWMIVINMVSTFASNSLPGEFLTSTNLSHAALRQCLALPR